MPKPTSQEEIWAAVKLGIVIIVGVLLVYFILTFSAIGNEGGGVYTRADCIQQWRDTGMLGNVDDMCSKYP